MYIHAPRLYPVVNITIVMGKSGILTAEEEAIYERIKSYQKEREVNYSKYVSELAPSAMEEILTTCQKFGLDINLKTGGLNYGKTFERENLKYELCYVRHGKTEGNTEPRVYQGQVDYEENQLNAIGLKQAEDAADKMDEILKSGWTPDVIIYSPMTRAIETGQKFASRHKEIPTRILELSAEMAFGDWDNKRVIDIPPESLAHSFYLNQNAIVKSNKSHKVLDSWKGPSKPSEIKAENFLQLVSRMHQCLRAVNELPEISSIQGRMPRVLMYGHSMAGAAINLLLGHGELCNETNSFGFDGKYVMPNATPTLFKSNAERKIFV